MPYVPGCQYDLFISYAGENNRNHWVDLFKDALIDELEQLLGRQFSRESVFFDKTELRIGQHFPETLEKAAEASALLIPILSPGYLTSDWCNRERTAFFKRLPDGATPAECLAPILVRPIDETSLMEVFRSAQRIAFLKPGQMEPWPAGSPEWTSELKKFAAQMMTALQNLRRKCKPVFLGRVPPGMDHVREMCATELQNRLFQVGPETLHVLDDEGMFTRALQQAALSVHFIGGANDLALRAIEVAAEVCPGATILYCPFGAIRTADEELWLNEFERSLKTTGAGRYQRIESNNDQELLAVLEREITRLQPPAPTAAQQAALGLVCDESDLELARSLRTEIEQRDRLTVSYPSFLESRSTAMERKRKWTELVNTSQALLFCWGQAKDTAVLDIIYGLATTAKTRPELAWYLSQPDLNQKRQKYPRGICQTGEFSYEALTPFLNPLLRQRPAAQ